MKNIAVGIAMALGVTSVTAQTIKNETLNSYNKGLFVLNMNNGSDYIKLGGFLQTSGIYTNATNQQDEYRFDVSDAYLNLEGAFLKDKFNFLLQVNFVDRNPLLDAWIAYKPIEQLRITAGQMQTTTNSRGMLFLDQGRAFFERSLMNQAFNRTGRELGIFLDSRLPAGCVGFDLQAAVTTGDGRNSFGSNSLDVDKGGLKYGGRATFYPMGFFKAGNELLAVDFAREERPKLALGYAYSYNTGASNAVGEGHGDFAMYDVNGRGKYPGYQKMSADLLFKYRGFSLLAEYTNAVGADLQKLYTSATGDKLQPREIADYLVLGNGYSVQAGYLFPSLWSIDASFAMVKPEWKESSSSALKESEETRLAVSKYFKGNMFKISAEGAYRRFIQSGENEFRAQVGVHVMF